jgi:ribose 5-phosphate isomerase B
MAANKVPGVRAAACCDRATAINSRAHNDANILTLGSGIVTQDTALDIVRVWLDTPAEGGRHARRVGKIMDIERRGSGGTTKAAADPPAPGIERHAV